MDCDSCGKSRTVLIRIGCLVFPSLKGGGEVSRDNIKIDAISDDGRGVADLRWVGKGSSRWKRGPGPFGFIDIFAAVKLAAENGSHANHAMQIERKCSQTGAFRLLPHPQIEIRRAKVGNQRDISRIALLALCQFG